MSALKWAATNADSLLSDLDLPPAAYRALLKLRARSEPGGRIAMDQATLGELLGLSRPSVNAALRSLELAKLVKKVRNGVYQINPMLALLHLSRGRRGRRQGHAQGGPSGQQGLRGELPQGRRCVPGPARRTA